MKVVVVEELSERTLSEHASLIAGADVCIPLRVTSGTAAAAAAGDRRWWVETLPVLEATAARHARWVYELTRDQGPLGDGSGGEYDALVAYGLEVRLRSSAQALAFVRQSVQEHGSSLGRVDLTLVGHDPYLRDTFTHSQIVPQLGSVVVQRTRRARSWRRGIRERAAASRLVRRVVRAKGSMTLAGRRAPARGPDDASGPTAALFVQNSYQLSLFSAIHQRLQSSGWNVTPFSYGGTDASQPGEGESFARAVRRAAASTGTRMRMPRWNLSKQLLAEGPVSEKLLRVALKASWLTGQEQTRLHRRLLAARRPDVVMSFTSDSMSLGLQVAAESLGIPSLFLNHGPLGPVFSPWFFRWSALALAGPPCVEAYRVGPLGVRNRGLVAVGYPPYDALLSEAARLGPVTPVLDRLGHPADRPYVVAVFAEYGDRFWVHVLQQRLLRVVAEALPPDCFLVCKLHPAGEEEREPCERILSSLLPPGAFGVVGERQYTTPQLLAGSHVAVAIERCGALIDAIFMGRPGIGLRVPEIPPGSSNLNQVAKLQEFWKCCRIVEERAGLREALLALTRNAAAREELVRNRKTYIETFFSASDGRSSDRIAELIQHLGARKDPEEFVPTIGPSLIETR